MINPFKKTYTEEEYNTFVFLANMRLFADLNYKQMAHFLPIMHSRSYEKDEVVFFRNDPSQALYLLRKGEVALNIDIDNSFEHLTNIKAPASIGESCLLKKAKRQLNALVVSERADFYVLPKGNIDDILEDNLKIKSKMFEAIAEIYNAYNHRLFKAYRSSSGFFNLQQVYDQNQIRK